jgi:hypothetical protein
MHYILKLNTIKHRKKSRPEVKKNMKLYFGDNKTEEDYIYLITADQFKKNCKPLIKNNITWNVGTVIYPFRWRPQTGVFEQTANIGLVFGFSQKFRGSKDWSYGFYGGGSGTSNIIDSATTNGNEKNNTTITTLTPTFDFVLSWRTVQLTLGSGCDILVGEHSPTITSWIYKNRGWIGLGLGIGIFNNSPASTGDPSQK